MPMPASHSHPAQSPPSPPPSLPIFSFVGPLRMDSSLLEENYVRRAYQDLKDRLAETEKNGDETSQSKRQRLPYIASLLKTIPANSLILDIGCGEHLASRDGSFSIGMDICLPISANKLLWNGATNFVLADMLHPPFREGLFDCIFMVSVLHHIPSEQRRLKCLKSGLSLAHPKMSNFLVSVWAKEQQSAKFPSNDVLVPYNLEDLWKGGHIAQIPFNKQSTKEQRIIMNSIPVAVADENSLLRTCCRQYLPKRVQKHLMEMASRVASIYPMFVSIDFYEEHLQIVLKFVSERIGQIKSIQGGSSGVKNCAPNVMMAILRQFATRTSQCILEQAFSHLRSLHREVLRYRYYHVFGQGELEHLLGQIHLALPGKQFAILKSDYEFGNWLIHVGGGGIDRAAGGQAELL